MPLRYDIPDSPQVGLFPYVGTSGAYERRFFPGLGQLFGHPGQGIYGQQLDPPQEPEDLDPKMQRYPLSGNRDPMTTRMFSRLVNPVVY